MAILTTLLYIIGILCAVWVIYDVLVNNKRLSGGMKVLWIVLAIVFSIITAIIYYLVYKR
ncbi:MAG: PLDc N-terminal domain-containing protein [Candidatus Pacearchaeota archaeon]